MRKITVFLGLALLSLATVNAQKDITLEGIWKNYEFYAKSVPGFNFLQDGKHYTRLEDDKILQYDITSGEQVATIFDPATVRGNEDFTGKIDGYEFSADESKIVVRSGTESIYRRSYRANYFIYDREAKTLQTVFTEGKHSYADLNPQGDKVAFVYQNNLYYKDLESGSIVQITQDGQHNQIIYGATDWVYEEEFGFAKAFFWSPNGDRLAYYRFDESEVKEFTMTNYHDEMYPEYVTFKYPKVGEDNAEVDVFIYSTQGGEPVKVDLGSAKEYVPRIKWTASSDELCVYRMNRHQNHLELLLANAKNGQTKLLLEEKNQYYIAESVLDNLTFLKDGKRFIWSSEKDGWHHIYLYNMKGKALRQITKGKWEVSTLYGVDEANGRVYYQAAEKSPMERQVYSIGLDGEDKIIIAGASGWNSAQFSSTYDYYVASFSTANTPTTYTVFDQKGRRLRTIEENKSLKGKQVEYGTQPVEFFSFTTKDKVALNGWMIKPTDFRANRKYPVFMYLYGGPGSQQVTDSWKGSNYWWFQMLAQQGYIVACVDNRGTGGRGEEFKKMTYKQLGHYETIDQIEAARYLGGLPYTDESRIAIFGWSYGGYMSSLCLLKGNEVFKAAIAVAPVTNWKWYDTIYTERYMQTYKENEAGYRDNSPVYFADRLKGDYLLVHGLGDDNVHFQHTAEMANALIAANKQFDTYFYPNRNHGIYGDNARLHLYQKMTDFLEDSLEPEKTVINRAEQSMKSDKKKVSPRLQIAPSQKLSAPLKKDGKYEEQ
ncbi:S9 family peptidase [Phaeodactylibacter luteus]|uniref:S9 family peptidase n=1 Tax=Phaeodactylibacter luteus TaxID=1564516 RepID=A0A5C6RLQ1_9BACT|nr:S9 family peptidase [Phaeodactylibacter luteus]TXB63183.1 S9 family peptidase [Phaeodactylibacter luteus]